MKTLLAALLGLMALTGATAASAAEATTAKAILAGGCFWCLEKDFRALPGVVNATSGYSGGSIANPTYQNYHDTPDASTVPHVEVVEVVYDPAKVGYEKILDYYFRHVDPTDGGGQFCDRGPAYAPVIYTTNDAEKAAAQKKSAEVAKLIKAKVAVDIRDAKPFWPAEDYHQDYAHKNPLKYQYYRWNCGRDQRVTEVWGQTTN